MPFRQAPAHAPFLPLFLFYYDSCPWNREAAVGSALNGYLRLNIYMAEYSITILLF